jgi:hypothetical protein
MAFILECFTNMVVPSAREYYMEWPKGDVDWDHLPFDDRMAAHITVSIVRAFLEGG